jgi:hypothetical protein
MLRHENVAVDIEVQLCPQIVECSCEFQLESLRVKHPSAAISPCVDVMEMVCTTVVVLAAQAHFTLNFEGCIHHKTMYVS